MLKPLKKNKVAELTKAELQAALEEAQAKIQELEKANQSQKEIIEAGDKAVAEAKLLEEQLTKSNKAQGELYKELEGLRKRSVQQEETIETLRESLELAETTAPAPEDAAAAKELKPGIYLKDNFLNFPGYGLVEKSNKPITEEQFNALMTVHKTEEGWSKEKVLRKYFVIVE